MCMTNCIYYKNMGYVPFSSIVSEQLVMSLSMKDRALLIKLFYKNGDYALAALKKFSETDKN